jgi:hypothetical protein
VTCDVIPMPRELAEEVFDQMWGDHVQIDSEWGDCRCDPLDEEVIRDVGLLLCGHLGHDFTNGSSKRLNKACRRCKAKREG